MFRCPVPVAFRLLRIHLRLLVIGLQDNRRGMFTLKTHGATAVGVDPVGRVTIKPYLRTVGLVLAADNLRPQHLNAHAFDIESQVLYPALGKIAFAPLQGVGVENLGEGVVVDQHNVAL